MQLGYIDYLNCYPFYYHMFEREPVAGTRIVAGYPSLLNRLMAEAYLDMSPVSSATCAELSEEIVVLPDFCLSSVGYVGSVMLVSKVPIEALHHKRIGLTSASHTSVVLLKMLLQQYYQIEPFYVTTGPRPSLDMVDAALLIGNDAMQRRAKPDPYAYDLGDLWLRRTGFPVVFAVFAVRRKAILDHEDQIRAIIRSYKRSLACLQKEREQVIWKARARYSDIIYDVNAYYKLLRFEFTDTLKQALMFYFSMAADLNLLPKIEALRYLVFEDNPDDLIKCA